jgi:hypothetical protein
MEANLQQLAQYRTRAAFVLKQIRIGHENQLHRLTDLELTAVMQDSGFHISLFQVRTLLQDLKQVGYIDFREEFNEDAGCMAIREIVLSAEGLRFYLRRKSNDLVRFD